MIRSIARILVVAAALCGAQALAAAGPVVTAPAGALRGEALEGVNAFRGIPYAQPPVGSSLASAGPGRALGGRA